MAVRKAQPSTSTNQRERNGLKLETYLLSVDIVFALCFPMASCWLLGEASENSGQYTRRVDMAAVLELHFVIYILWSGIVHFIFFILNSQLQPCFCSNIIFTRF